MIAGCGPKEEPAVSTPTLEAEVNVMKRTTADVSLLFADALIKTDRMAEEAKTMDYESFIVYMNDLIAEWELIDQMSEELEVIADDVVERVEDEFSFHIVEPVFAYSEWDYAMEIAKMFDAAPAGKRIKTLAEKLGVSAKEASSILKQSQKYVAWQEDEAGEAFEFLENTARVVKDSCKVTLLVGGAVMTGGSMTLLGGTSLIVSGADLVLEIGEDATIIALGDDNQVNTFTTIRKATKPVASILTFSNIMTSGSALEDILDACVFSSDLIIGAAYDQEFMGIKIDFSEKKVQTYDIPANEKEKWLKDQGHTAEVSSDKVVESVLKSAENVITRREMTLQEWLEEQPEWEDEEPPAEEKEIILEEKDELPKTDMILQEWVEEQPELEDEEPPAEPVAAFDDVAIANSLAGTEWHVQAERNRNQGLYISFSSNTLTLLNQRSANGPKINVGFYSYSYQNYKGNAPDGFISFSIQDGVLHVYDMMTGNLIYTATRVK